MHVKTEDKASEHPDSVRLGHQGVSRAQQAWRLAQHVAAAARATAAARRGQGTAAGVPRRHSV